MNIHGPTHLHINKNNSKSFKSYNGLRSVLFGFGLETYRKGLILPNLTVHWLLGIVKAVMPGNFPASPVEMTSGPPYSRKLKHLGVAQGHSELSVSRGASHVSQILSSLALSLRRTRELPHARVASDLTS